MEKIFCLKTAFLCVIYNMNARARGGENFFKKIFEKRLTNSTKGAIIRPTEQVSGHNLVLIFYAVVPCVLGRRNPLTEDI